MADNVVSRCRPQRHVEQPVTCVPVTFTAHFHRQDCHLVRGERPSGLSAAASVQGFQIYHCCRPSFSNPPQTTTCVYCTNFTNTVSVKSLFWSSHSFHSRFSGKRRFLVPAQRVSGAFLPTSLHVRHPDVHLIFVCRSPPSQPKSSTPRNLRHFTLTSSPTSDYRNPILHHG